MVPLDSSPPSGQGTGHPADAPLNFVGGAAALPMEGELPIGTTVIRELTAPVTIDGIIAMLNDLTCVLRTLRARASPTSS